MIEGLRSLPWLQERIRKSKNDVEQYLDCDKCMSDVPEDIREFQGCAYTRKPPHHGRDVWMHPGYTDAKPTTCPGYTTKLPEVIEINFARMHAKNNMAEHFMPGGATENVMRGIGILEGAVNEANCWRPEDEK